MLVLPFEKSLALTRSSSSTTVLAFFRIHKVFLYLFLNNRLVTLAKVFSFYSILCIYQTLSAGMPCGIRPYSRRIKRIVNGQNALPHSWPWMAQLLLDSDHKCGATLVQEQFVLTAVHCIRLSRNLSRWTIRLGEHNRCLSEGTEQDFHITKEFIHPLYNRYRIQMTSLD